MKKLCRLIAMCVGLAASTVSFAADSTLRGPIHLVVPYSAGGVADVLARIVADKTRDAFPGGVLVENRTGAGGNIGANHVFRSKPDGRTLLVSSPGPIAVNQGLYPNLPFDPSKWEPVTLLASVPNALIVSDKVEAKTASEFVDYAKANPGTLTYATQGNGTTSHLTAKLFESIVGTDMIHVPYKGDTPALTDLAGSQVDAFFGSVGASLALHNAGKIRILAVADSQRSKAVPEVPSFAELGLPDMRSVTWYAVVAPPGTPKETVAELNKAIAEALAQPDVSERLSDLGLEPRAMSVAETRQFLQEETQRWQSVIRDANVVLE